MARLSDEQVRQILAAKLKQGAADQLPPPGRGSDDGFEAFFNDLVQDGMTVKERIAFFFNGGESESWQWKAVLGKLSAGKGLGHLLMTIFFGLAFIACGLIVERLLLRSTEDLRKQLLSSGALGKLQRLGRFCSRFLLDAFGIVVYIFVTLVLIVIVYDSGTADYAIVFDFLIVSYYFRIIVFFARVILSPTSSALRLLPLENRDALFLYDWIVRIALIAALLGLPALVFLRAGESDTFGNLFFILSGLSVIVFMIAMIWQSKGRVAEAICADAADKTGGPSPLRERFARAWHFFAILYVAGAGIFWLINVFTGTRGEITKLIASLFLIPIFIGIDQWAQRLLKIASGELPEIINLDEEDTAEAIEEEPRDAKADIQHFVPVIRRVFRILLVTLLFFIVLKMWGIDLSFGRVLTKSAMGIVVTLLLGFVVWQLLKARIDRKLKEEMPDESEDVEEGGAGGSRNVTLLLLLRKFLLSVMFVLVALIVLSSIGVNIGPLIAGAGVIGLAIGFGAQTLVKDIISGVFFLIDDAFRVGDYVQTAGVKGTVEHISLRSMKLRDPKGMVITIPFGDMGTVTNFSRDYIITKLNFRVRYDTDMEKVRKIVKKINKELARNEEIAPVLLDKIKSQGVREMGDSAMIMRVKFKTIPGQQFIVRRHVYHSMQKKFQEAGIEFAHRNVTVYLPHDESNTPPGTGRKEDSTAKSNLDKAIAGAGAAAVIAATRAEADAEAKEKKK